MNLSKCISQMSIFDEVSIFSDVLFLGQFVNILISLIDFKNIIFQKYVMTSSVFVSFFLIFQKWIQFFYFWWIYWTFISFLTILDVKREKTSKTIWNDELKWFLNQKQFEERFLWCSIFRTIPQHLNFTHSFQKWHLLKINFCFTK